VTAAQISRGANIFFSAATVDNFVHNLRPSLSYALSGLPGGSLPSFLAAHLLAWTSAADGLFESDARR
jgi:hypothetical protein